MSSCWLIEIEESAQESGRLRQLGMVSFETASWRYLAGRTRALRNLLEQAAIVTDTRESTFLISSLLTSQGDSVTKQLADIQDYFFELTRQSLDRFGISSIAEDNLPDVLVWNLMPFYPRAAIAERVMRGVCRAIEQFPRLSNVYLVFLVRTNLEFSRSTALKQLIQSGVNQNKAVIIDRDGLCVTIERNTTKDANEPRIFKTSLSRSIFEEILRLDENSFRRALVYQTNINIGHFDVGTCHVRTHYDLTDFVSRDNVFEHLYGKFCIVTSGFINTTLITTGLEKKALTILANRLVSWSGNDPFWLGDKCSRKRTVKWIGHLAVSEVYSRARELEECFKDSDCVLIITDVVNSGSTALGLKKALEVVCQSQYAKTEESNKDCSIKTFAVVRMINSPSEIEATVTIGRPYYLDDSSKCPLCLLGQPIKKVNEETWELDFRSVHPAQPTPLDFWEMVLDCSALRQKETYLSGIRLTHRVDTRRIVERYSHWLTNVIRAKYVNAWGNNLPDVILTVKEETGLRFADLVSRALRPHGCRIIGIPRVALDELQEPSADLVDELHRCERQASSALLVDDGINLGGTARKLYRFIQKYSFSVLGMFVLDSRLGKIELEKLGVETPDHPLVVIYSWPSRPVEAS